MINRFRGGRASPLTVEISVPFDIMARGKFYYLVFFKEISHMGIYAPVTRVMLCEQITIKVSVYGRTNPGPR